MKMTHKIQTISKKECNLKMNRTPKMKEENSNNYDNLKEKATVG